MDTAENNLSLSEKQLKAVRAVERAIRKAKKTGVTFFLNYETLSAYADEKITTPLPDEKMGDMTNAGYGEANIVVDPFYELKIGSVASNADDPLYFNKKTK